MFNVQINYPDDMSEIINHIINFQADKLINEYSEKEVEAVINYLENQIHK